MRKTLIITLILALLAVAGFAQSTTTATADETATTQTVVGKVVLEQQDSNLTRSEFRQLLERHPPQVGRVLKLDPTLFRNEAWLATYPELTAYIAKHPEVAHNSAYYLEGISNPWEAPQERTAERIWRDTMEGVSIFLVLITITGVLAWLIRTIIEHRRWSRVSKVQAEVHNKLLDRFGTNEELLAYIQTPGGKRFLESAPLALETASPRPSAPVNRILWSIQAGLIILAAGIGLQFVSASIDKDVAQPLFAMGVLAISIGVGFVVSAIVSFFISRRLGLWESALPKTAE